MTAQRVIPVGQSRDAGRQRNLLAFQPMRVTCSVEMLMVRERDLASKV